MSDASSTTDALVDERALSKLRWRCRRGLLENDILIARFFERHSATLTEKQASGLRDLMDLTDNDLLDVLLARKAPQDFCLNTLAGDVVQLIRHTD